MDSPLGSLDPALHWEEGLELACIAGAGIGDQQRKGRKGGSWSESLVCCLYNLERGTSCRPLLPPLPVGTHGNWESRQLPLPLLRS